MQGPDALPRAGLSRQLSGSGALLGDVLLWHKTQHVLWQWPNTVRAFVIDKYQDEVPEFRSDIPVLIAVNVSEPGLDSAAPGFTRPIHAQHFRLPT